MNPLTLTLLIALSAALHIIAVAIIIKHAEGK